VSGSAPAGPPSQAPVPAERSCLPLRALQWDAMRIVFLFSRGLHPFKATLMLLLALASSTSAKCPVTSWIMAISAKFCSIPASHAHKCTYIGPPPEPTLKPGFQSGIVCMSGSSEVVVLKEDGSVMSSCDWKFGYGDRPSGTVDFDRVNVPATEAALCGDSPLNNYDPRSDYVERHATWLKGDLDVDGVTYKFEYKVVDFVDNRNGSTHKICILPGPPCSAGAVVRVSGLTFDSFECTGITETRAAQCNKGVPQTGASCSVTVGSTTYPVINLKF